MRSICTFMDDGFLTSLSTFQNCIPYWLYPENTILFFTDSLPVCFLLFHVIYEIFVALIDKFCRQGIWASMLKREVFWSWTFPSTLNHKIIKNCYSSILIPFPSTKIKSSQSLEGYYQSFNSSIIHKLYNWFHCLFFLEQDYQSQI